MNYFKVICNYCDTEEEYYTTAKETLICGKCGKKVDEKSRETLDNFALKVRQFNIADVK